MPTPAPGIDPHRRHDRAARRRDIFGGRGTILGVVLAFFTLAVLQNVLRLANVSADFQSIALGLLLIVSVAIPTFARRAQRLSTGLREVGVRRPDRSAQVRR